MSEWKFLPEETVNKVNMLSDTCQAMQDLVKKHPLPKESTEEVFTEYYSLLNVAGDLRKYLYEQAAQILTAGTMIELHDGRQLLIGHLAEGTYPTFGTGDSLYGVEVDFSQIKKFKKVLDF